MKDLIWGLGSKIAAFFEEIGFDKGTLQIMCIGAHIFLSAPKERSSTCNGQLILTPSGHKGIEVMLQEPQKTFI